MNRIWSVILWILRVSMALSAGAITGIALVLCLIEGRLTVLGEAIRRAIWIINGRPLIIGEADGGWMFEAELLTVVRCALMVITVSAVIWAAIGLLKRQGYRSAAIIGLAVSAIFAFALSQPLETLQSGVQVALIGVAGTIAGLVTRAVDRGLARFG